MMKRLIMGLLAGLIAMMMVISAAAFADEVGPYSPPPEYTCGDYSYIFNEDKTVTISRYNGQEEEIVIPAELDGHKVTKIGMEAFTYKKMKSLTIPAEITDIARRAFEYCRISEYLEFPADIRIGTYAFSYASLPSVVIIPEGAQVSKEAFSYNKTSEILVVNADAVLGERSFGYSEALKTVVCTEGASLEKDAFEYCYQLERAILCGDVQIHKDAFSYCRNVRFAQGSKEDLSMVLSELSIEGKKAP